ncbi:MAG: hypothetical protein LBS85_01325 [Clostridiales Family XIII bacterium]|jgi:hypothetical protein|nr:hypothetical protein [Clostridiales Family XIII bacterium]
MERIIEVKPGSPGATALSPHEKTIIAEGLAPFLPPFTFVAAAGGESLLFSCEGLLPAAWFASARGAEPSFSEAPRSPKRPVLNDLFLILEDYIRCIAKARDLLLNTARISSDPVNGVYAAPGGAVRVVYGPDEYSGAGEKIRRLALCFAGCESIMGAKPSMEQVAERIHESGPALRDCLKLTESIHREWNYII